MSGTQGTGGVRTGTITLANGQKVSVTVTQKRTGGQAGWVRGTTGVTSPTKDQGDFSATAAGSQRAWANFKDNNRLNSYVVDPTSTNSVLTLNQGTSSAAAPAKRASETLTFSFTSSTGAALTPVSMTFKTYDITSQLDNMNDNAYCTDKLIFGGATAIYGDPVGTPSTYDATSSYLCSTGTNTSKSTGNYIPVTLKPSTSKPTINYSNTAPKSTLNAGNNYQYAGIGDVTICF
ncbi:hypothetical protein ACXA45_03830 [Neomicrococcus lactis]